jgi:MFS family permease
VVDAARKLYRDLMLLLDVTIVNVALPSIERDLGANFSDLQWVIDAYALTLAAFVGGGVAGRRARPQACLHARAGGLHRFVAGLRACSGSALPEPVSRGAGVAER